MQTASFPPPHATADMLFASLRAGLATSGRRPAIRGMKQDGLPFAPLSNDELLLLARAWRSRVAHGDQGADAVAAALESVAAARAAPPRNRIRAVVDRLSDLMQLS